MSYNQQLIAELAFLTSFPSPKGGRAMKQVYVMAITVSTADLFTFSVMGNL